MEVCYEKSCVPRPWVRTNPISEYFSREYHKRVEKKAACRNGHERMESIRESLMGEDRLLK